MTDQLALGACGHTTHLRSYGGGTIGAENISGPGAIGVAPDPTSTYLGGADMPQGIKADSDVCSIDGCDKPYQARGWCLKHYTRWKRHGDPLYVEYIVGDPVARFWSKVDKAGPLPLWAPFLGPCWHWTGATSNGYGRVRVDVDRPAHRFAYELLVGPIPDGLVIDHLCRVRHCVNPAHLEAVTNAENILRGNGFSARHARKTHCPKGHPYDEANTLIRADGSRNCIACGRDRG